MKNTLGLLLRVGLVCVCLYYVLADLELADFGQALARMAPLGILAAFLFLVVDYFLMGLRLRFASGGRAGIIDSFNAQVIGLGLNAFLPAKMGEVAKALYLRRMAGCTLGTCMGLVFWERFFDLNIMLTLVLVTSALTGGPAAVVPLSIAVGGLWGVLFLLRLCPGAGKLLIRLLYFPKLRSMGEDIVRTLSSGVSPSFLFGLAVLTALTWLFYCLQYFAVLNLSAGFGLDAQQLFIVFVIGAGGLALPSTPGGVGVYEAAIVWGLMLQGASKEEALAAGIVLHMLFTIPAALYAVGLLSVKGLSLRDIRTASKEEAKEGA